MQHKLLPIPSELIQSGIDLKKLEKNGFRYFDSIIATESSYVETMIKEVGLKPENVKRIGLGGKWYYLIKCKKKVLKKLHS
jgi:hypothetical protein